MLTARTSTGRGRVLAVPAPGDGVALPGGDGGSRHVGRGPDGGVAIPDVRPFGQGPGEGFQVHPQAV